MHPSQNVWISCAFSTNNSTLFFTGDVQQTSASVSTDSSSNNREREDLQQRTDSNTLTSQADDAGDMLVRRGWAHESPHVSVGSQEVFWSVSNWIWVWCNEHCLRRWLASVCQRCIKFANLSLYTVVHGVHVMSTQRYGGQWRWTDFSSKLASNVVMQCLKNFHFHRPYNVRSSNWPKWDI